MTNTPPTTTKQDLLLDEERHRAERAAEAERADVAHEDFRRIAVPPQEAEAGANERAAEDRQLRGFAS